MSKKKIAIVTAASRGMGASIARRLSEEGYGLVLMSRSEDLRLLARDLGASAHLGSVTNPDDLESLVNQALAEFGRIDAVVCNTGHPPKGDLLELQDDDWHAGLEMVFLNVVRMARLVTPVMMEQGGGRIVAVSTFGAVEPSLAFPVSSSLRAGLGAFIKLYADRYAGSGIRINAVLPGFIDSYDVDEETLERIPLGRAGSVREVAEVVNFLLTDAAGYLTGQSIRVDGGITRSI
jgi:NAD(P)-dependent dehydrogenase (short-subunit alcohol dehydrogenase family)